ncbi:glycosyltransferase family 4 protein [Acetobacteraceae bacterium ESL0709]|nr:glycosyltransferase family 4 protein [Acetobacteraceae bacterium ESL0697]MDF7678942.1 glycosyltransferase family 4 protein [Acetobacteraceae bacterium ESL0709]
MGRVVFLNTFANTEFTGGIKTTYRHAAMLNEEGIEASILQPGGPPLLLKDPVQRALARDSEPVNADDVVVYPEALNGWFGESINQKWPCTKIMFCQNPFYLYSYEITKKKLQDWKIERIIVPSQWAKESVRSVIGFDDVKVVTPIVDTKLFYPRPKELKIISASWKWSNHPVISSYGELVRKILVSKYPSLSDIPWVDLKGYTEEEVATLMGEAAVCLVLGAAEALGLTALEAMASECVVVGFHGAGGLDFATPRNGFWHSPEDIEGVVDSLALAVEGHKHQLELIRTICRNGRQTACYYNSDRTRANLKQSYQDLLYQRHSLTHL